MKKSIKRLACLAVAVMMSFTLLACGKTEEPSGDRGSKEPSKLDKVQLNVYVMGESPKEDIMTKFYEELDKLTLRDMNATVRFKFSTWADWQSKYNLMLSSGEDVDLCYSADWTNYPTYAAKDAFMALDDLLPKYAPNINKAIKPEIWDGVKVKGKIYGVPNQYPEYVQHGVSYREDLRKKYNCAEIKDVDTLGKYIETVMANEPTMKNGIVEPQAMQKFFVATTKYQYVDSQDPYGMCKGLVVDPNDLTNTVVYYGLPEYKEMAKLMKTWADKGFWSKSVLSTKEDNAVTFESGKSPVRFESLPMKTKESSEKIKLKHPDWEVGYFAYNEMNGIIYPCRANHNVMAVPRGAKNPERALMFLDKLQSDQEYFDLCTYGVKGLNYNLTDDGKLDYSKIDREKCNFDIAPWAWRTEEFFRKGVDDWNKWESTVSELKGKSKQDPLDGFVFDTANVQAEVAAVAQVEEQYARPLESGLVGNVDTAYDTLMKKLRDAGIDKVKAEVDKQLKEFVENKK